MSGADWVPTSFFPGKGREAAALRDGALAFDIAAARKRLADPGGYEIVLDTPTVEIGVYVLVAPEPDRQQPHADDEVYIVLEGEGVLTVEGRELPMREGAAVFVPAGADHRFTAYVELAVLVIFAKH